MSFKKKLFATVGPLFLALLILVGIFLMPNNAKKTSPRVIAEASTSMAVNVIKGNDIKNAAMKSQQPRYVPFFGSSELSRVNAYHPSVLAEKYQRNYQPFLLGAPGTQSISHFLMLQSMTNQLHGKKAVFIISPQWFVPKGVSKEMFSLYYSPLQTYQWLKNIQEISPYDQYLAQRLLSFESVRSDTTMKSLLKQIKRGKKLTSSQEQMCDIRLGVLSREDELFARLGMVSKELKVKMKLKQLPAKYDPVALDKLAYQRGKEQTTGNDFQINKKFYRQRVAPVMHRLKNSQVNYDYRQSVEFADFQLILNQLDKLDMDVLFVIPPVNGRWAEFTGLSTEMLDGYQAKIKEQLLNQGFTRIADFSDKRNEEYFMEDTIHLGWRGWVALDKEVAPFLEEVHPKPSYSIDTYYLSKDWQKKVVSVEQK